MDVMKQGSDRAEVTPGFQSKAMSALLKCVCILCCGKIASETGIAAWEDHKAGVLSHLSVLWLSGNWCWLPIRRASSRCRKRWDRSCWATRAGERRWPWLPSAVCLVCFRNTLSFCQKAGSDRFHCYSEYFWFHLEFPTPNILKIYAFSKILDNVIRSKKGKWKIEVEIL